MAIALSSCATIPSGRGAEDIVRINLEGSPALLTATGTRAPGSFILPLRGQLELLKQGENAFTPSAAQPESAPFHPYGISYVETSRSPDADLYGKSLVYTTGVTDCGNPTAHIFEIRYGQILYLKDLPSLRGFDGNFNGIAAASDGTVYASILNILPSRREPQIVSEHMPAEKGVVVALGNSGDICKKWEVVIRDLDGPNGIAFTEDEMGILVCGYHAKKVYAFKRKGAGDHQLSGIAGVAAQGISFKPDNISRDPGGSQYFIAGQSNSFLTVLGFIIPWTPVPSRWATFTYPSPSTDLVEHHAPSRAVSVAVPFGNDVYLGSINRKGVTRITPSP